MESHNNIQRATTPPPGPHAVRLQQYPAQFDCGHAHRRQWLHDSQPSPTICYNCDEVATRQRLVEYAYSIEEKVELAEQELDGLMRVADPARKEMPANLREKLNKAKSQWHLLQWQELLLCNRAISAFVERWGGHWRWNHYHDYPVVGQMVVKFEPVEEDGRFLPRPDYQLNTGI